MEAISFKTIHDIAQEFELWSTVAINFWLITSGTCLFVLRFSRIPISAGTLFDIGVNAFFVVGLIASNIFIWRIEISMGVPKLLLAIVLPVADLLAIRYYIYFLRIIGPPPK